MSDVRFGTIIDTTIFHKSLVPTKNQLLLAGSVLHLRRNYCGTVKTDVVSLRDTITT